MTAQELNDFATTEIRRFLVFLAENKVTINESVLKMYEQKFSMDKNIFNTAVLGFSDYYKTNLKV